MEYHDYLRDLAFQNWQLAENTIDSATKDGLLELAIACEEIADTFEDRLPAG